MATIRTWSGSCGCVTLRRLSHSGCASPICVSRLYMVGSMRNIEDLDELPPKRGENAPANVKLS
eukprot:scaffold87435_cov66-Phaeocystis_antarctica.AAC.1